MGYLCPTSCINGCRTKKNNSAQPTHRCLVRKRKGSFFCKHSYIRWGHRQPARADFFTLFSSQPFYDEVSRRAIFSFRCVCRRFAISFWENCKDLAVRSTGRRTGGKVLPSGLRPCGRLPTPLPSPPPSASGFRPLPSASPLCGRLPSPAVRLHTLCGRPVGGPWAAPKCIVALTFITFGNDFVTGLCHQRAACADLSGR